MGIRTVNPSDYYEISPQINDWWGKRNVASMLPKLCFDYFTDPSFIIEKRWGTYWFLTSKPCESR